ncbi:uroporphyrinogen-III C-methyltransferase [bacterium A37T11]|nr:uroporphyrinogen-III C-methyltransferase [bacterium A37T11]
MNHSPKLTLVGAGPGDAELITLKGVRCLADADVVLYDALVNEELLDFVPVNVPRVYVGKRSGQHSYSQDEINTLIVDFANQYGHVVRLKGGDSFVFGRGYEELRYAEDHGLQTTVVPGISSSIAVPELQKIPLTSRGLSESYWVITATNRHKQLSADIYKAVETNATIIILMGVARLPEIRQLYLDAGKGEVAIAVIQNGSLPEEKVVVSNMENIIEAVKDQQVGAPAVIVIGEVVKEHAEYQKIVETYVQHPY